MCAAGVKLYRARALTPGHVLLGSRSFRLSAASLRRVQAHGAGRLPAGVLGRRRGHLLAQVRCLPGALLLIMFSFSLPDVSVMESLAMWIRSSVRWGRIYATWPRSSSSPGSTFSPTGASCRAGPAGPWPSGQRTSPPLLFPRRLYSSTGRGGPADTSHWFPLFGSVGLRPGLPLPAAVLRPSSVSRPSGRLRLAVSVRRDRNWPSAAHGLAGCSTAGRAQLLAPSGARHSTLLRPPHPALSAGDLASVCGTSTSSSTARSSSAP